MDGRTDGRTNGHSVVIIHVCHRHNLGIIKAKRFVREFRQFIDNAHILIFNGIKLQTFIISLVMNLHGVRITDKVYWVSQSRARKMTLSCRHRIDCDLKWLAASADTADKIDRCLSKC